MGKSRTFDVVIWGATGFTGQLVAEDLTRRYGANSKKLRWTIAGRNEQKLSRIRTALCEIDPAAKDLPLLLGDSTDPDSLRALAAQTHVICTTVGPYAKYGSELVAACIEEHTDYCDLTGEVPWIREMIDQHHASAQKNKVRIVHCCGFDSIPSDLGCFMMHEAMQEKYGVPCTTVKAYLGKSKGGVSGGTIASMMGMMDRASDPKVRKVLGNPYALDPTDAPAGPPSQDQRSVEWDPELKMWLSPFVMASINTRIVRRSNALQDYAYGKDFLYHEATGTPQGLKGWWRATSATWGLGAFMLFMTRKTGRTLLQKYILPAPGEGPSKETQENGYFNMHMYARTNDHILHGLVHGPKDPGYGSTAIMLSESAICLANNKEQLPERYGVLTPASAMGSQLIERLSNAGLTFKVAEERIAPQK